MSAARNASELASVTFGPKCSEPLSRSALLSWLRSDCQASRRKNEAPLGSPQRGDDQRSKIEAVVIHCSATRSDQDYPYERLARDHLKRGFKSYPGYHFYVTKDGHLYYCRPLDAIGCHVRSHNEGTIGVCYEGGLDQWGKPTDTRTAEQMITLHWLLVTLHKMFPHARICGHRDFSPDRNGNGRIDPWERIKACPCFDAAHEYAYIFGPK